MSYYINMKTIFNDIKEKQLKRADKLESLGLPKHFADNMRKAWESNKAWEIKGMKEFGHLEFERCEVRIGRGGKIYRVYKTEMGNILCFPQARYGIFITMEK